MLDARMDEGVTDMTLGDFLSVCDGDIRITLNVEGRNGESKEVCTLQAWRLERLIEAVCLVDAEDIKTRISYLARGTDSDIEISLSQEEE